MTSGLHPFSRAHALRPGPGSAGGSSHALNPFAFVNDAIVQAAREAIITIDEDQRVVMINPAAQRMFGFSAVEALGMGLGRLIPKRYRKDHVLRVREFDQSGTAERPMGERANVMGLRADGTEFPVEVTISRLDVIDDMGPRRFFTALLRDLSEVRELRSEIEALNNRLRAVFEVSPIAIWISDQDQIVFANCACVTLFGAASPQDLLGRSAYSLLAPECRDAVKTSVSNALAQGRNGPALTTNAWISRPDGDRREVEIAIAGLPDHGATTVQMVITDYTHRNRENRELQRSRRELRQLSASLTDAREEERRRIARELHDELGQRLTALQMDLSRLTSAVPVTARERIASMLAMVEETIASVRRISTDLRPLMLDDLGLASAIEWLAIGWEKRTGIAVKHDLIQQDLGLIDSAAIAMYRMVQEALTNVARHAKATKVKIQLQRKADELVLMVQDNGIGFDTAKALREGSHGLLGIRERAYMLGGQLEIGNSRSGGARILVRVPIDRVQVAAPSGRAPNPEPGITTSGGIPELPGS